SSRGANGGTPRPRRRRPPAHPRASAGPRWSPPSAVRAPRLVDLGPRVVGGTGERARLYVTEAERQPDVPQLGELRGRVVARDRQMAVGGAQILAQGHDVHVAAAEVAEAAHDLVPFLTQAEDDGRLGEGVGGQAPSPGQE